MIQATAVIIAIGLIIVVVWFKRGARKWRQVSKVLRVGQPLPEFTAIDERGDRVGSSDLLGTATVMLFVRGNWCPFCSSQVENLTSYYKSIVDLGGRLIFVTPKPLETTRRVAEFFEVEFDFWLDESLAIATKLDLLHAGAVPINSQKEYGADTVWPAAVVIDRRGIMRFVEQSKYIADRPNPQVLLRELRKVVGG